MDICSLGIKICILYVEHKVNQKSGFRYQDDKVLFDEKRLKMTAMTQIFSRTFWKIDAASEL